jgi:hypothetical protein
LNNRKRPARIILEVGSGGVPWVVTSEVYRTRFDCDARTLLQIEVTTLAACDRYICFDKFAANHAKAKDEFEELISLGRGVPSGTVEFVKGNGAALPYAAHFADAVILSNILSAPVPGKLYMGSQYQTTQPREFCVSEEDKRSMLDEAVRVLKPGGSLIIANDLTPCYAQKALQHVAKLCKQGRIHLSREFGAYQETDDWIVWHSEYRLGPQPRRRAVENIAWNEQQKKAMRAWIDAWQKETFWMCI